VHGITEMRGVVLLALTTLKNFKLVLKYIGGS